MASFAAIYDTPRSSSQGALSQSTERNVAGSSAAPKPPHSLPHGCQPHARNGTVGIDNTTLAILVQLCAAFERSSTHDVEIVSEFVGQPPSARLRKSADDAGIRIGNKQIAVGAAACHALLHCGSNCTRLRRQVTNESSPFRPEHNGSPHAGRMSNMRWRIVWLLSWTHGGTAHDPRRSNWIHSRRAVAFRLCVGPQGKCA